MKTKILLISLTMLVTILTNTSCKKEKKISGCMDTKADNYNPDATEAGSCTYTAQGPGNASFEAAGSSSADAYGWIGYGTRSNNFTSYPCWKRLTNTAFMPTNGLYYMQISPYHDFYGSTLHAGIYKDNVFLNHVNSLTFDYSFESTGTNGTGSASDSILTGTINILFTSNGTVTLWTKTISSIPAGYGVGTKINNFQKQNETISLPSLPDKGRLTIQVKLSVIRNVLPSGWTGGPSMADENTFNFQIDNIRVQ